ncbi:MAG: mitochondrial fission ELM1 family protein, partial [Acetobacteraceae bacterium]|nr:mitochondrial fission ELM1 family protein [Acetobacteraceae bacterium]
MPTSTILSEPLAGLQAQALGLAEAAGLAPDVADLRPRAPWRWMTARLWPAPLRAVRLADPAADILIGAGGTAAVVCAALRRRGRALVQVQHPRMDPSRFDVVVVNRHDGLAGPNVVVTRTALHRATPARLAEAAAHWGPRLAHLPRPLVAVLVGGSNGRFRLDAPVAAALGKQLADMMQADRIGLALTPSRRTAPNAR